MCGDIDSIYTHLFQGFILEFDLKGRGVERGNNRKLCEDELSFGGVGSPTLHWKCLSLGLGNSLGGCGLNPSPKYEPCIYTVWVLVEDYYMYLGLQQILVFSNPTILIIQIHMYMLMTQSSVLCTLKCLKN